MKRNLQNRHLQFKILKNMVGDEVLYYSPFGDSYGVMSKKEAAKFAKWLETDLAPFVRAWAEA